MSAITFLDLTAATLQGALRRAVPIGTLAGGEIARIYDPATYAGKLDARGVFHEQHEFWHDGERFIRDDDMPLRDNHFIHPAQWTALRGFEARHYGTFDQGDSITITEVFQARVGDAAPLAPLWHADSAEAPGQRMYMVGSRVKALNVEYPLGEMRLQDLPEQFRQMRRHLRLQDAGTEREVFQAMYFDHNNGIGQNAANGVIVAPLDGLHRTSPYRAKFPDEAFYFGRMGVVRAVPR